MNLHFKIILLFTTFISVFHTSLNAAELLIGSSRISITPDKPVALNGQMHTRISKSVTSEVTATSLAIESREGNRKLDEVIFVSCDLVSIDQKVIDKTREAIKERIPEFNPRKLILNATHTHTGPVTRSGKYRIPEEGVMRPAEYVEFLVDQLAAVITSAWEKRQKGFVGYGMAHAVVAQNRRSVFEDGHAQMYGRTHLKNWRMFEGYEDHGVEVLFFWDQDKKLMATAVNVACPSQEVEGEHTVNADFWHQIRGSLQKKYGDQLDVLAWTGASGDQSPHLMYRKSAEERMRRLRGLSRLEEISRRVVRAWEEAYEGARQEMFSDVPLVHSVKTIELPLREVTDEEYARIQKEVEEMASQPKLYRKMLWKKKVLEKYERQKSGKLEPYRMELHAIRLGDVAIVTNDFELFTDFGIRMKAHSKAIQTFVIQLAGPGTYIPSKRAELGGGYSAIIESNNVGSEGGEILTDETVKLINSLWEEQ